MTECRVCLSGQETIFGVPLADCIGDTLADKRMWFYYASAAELNSIVKEKGWCVTHDESQAVVIPSGTVTVITSSTGCRGIRWSITSDDGDLKRAQFMLERMLEVFAELRTPTLGMTSFLEYMKSE